MQKKKWLQGMSIHSPALAWPLTGFENGAEMIQMEMELADDGRALDVISVQPLIMTVCCVAQM